VKNRFQSLPFKCDLQRYNVDARNAAAVKGAGAAGAGSAGGGADDAAAAAAKLIREAWGEMDE
jgi:hypothetical protein